MSIESPPWTLAAVFSSFAASSFFFLAALADRDVLLLSTYDESNGFNERYGDMDIFPSISLSIS